MKRESIHIRAAQTEDAASLFRLIEMLAEFEGLSERVAGSVDELADQLFGSSPAAEAVIAEAGSEIAGFAVFFSTFSSFLCRPGLWVGDLFVLPDYRGAGAGSALLGHIAALAIERRCARVEWRALDSNEPALRFYNRIGAEPMENWKMLRLEGDALNHVATW